MTAILWHLWMCLTGQTKPTLPAGRGKTMRSLDGTTWTYDPSEYDEWTLLDDAGKATMSVSFGPWPPLFRFAPVYARALSWLARLIGRLETYCRAKADEAKAALEAHESTRPKKS